MSFYFQDKLRRRELRLAGWDDNTRATIEALTRCGIYGVDDALLIAGLAASAAGAGTSIAGSEEAKSQMNAAQAAEVQRQTELQRQGNAAVQKTIPQTGADTAKQETDQGAAQRQSVYNALKQVANPVAGAPLPADQSQPNTTVGGPPEGGTPSEQALNLASARGNAWSNLTSQAASKEGGYQDWLTKENLANAEAGRQIGVIGAKAKGWAQTYPLEMFVAQHSGDALQGWGQLASALGGAASMAGAVGVGAGAGGLATKGAAGPVVDSVDTTQNPGAWSLIGNGNWVA